MKRPHRTALLVGALLTLALVACNNDDGGGVRIAGQDGSPINVTPTPTATGAGVTEGTGTPPAESPAVPTATPDGSPEATATAEVTGTPASAATPPSTPGAGTESGAGSASGGLTGVPYSTADVRAALGASGEPVEVDDEREPLCAGTSVPETALRLGESAWALWVYPDASAREAEWELSDGRLEPQFPDCEPPSGFNYFNANTVLVLLEGISLAEPVRDAFLGMGTVAPQEAD